MCGEQLERFDEALRADVPVARQALRKLLPEPLRLSPATADGRRTLRFDGVTTLGPLLQKVWRPHGDPLASRQVVELDFGDTTPLGLGLPSRS